MNWSPDQITFMIDGVGYYTYRPSVKNNNTWPFDLDQFLLLNVAIGGFSGTPDSNFTESSMIIDYVRVYQQSTASTDDFFSSKFVIYPNPAKESVKIKTKESIDRIEIYSSLGQKVYSKSSKINEINTRSLSSGVYLVKIHSNNKVANKKLIIE